MRKITLIALILAMLSVFLLSCSQQPSQPGGDGTAQPPAPKGDIAIGFVAPFTGDVANYGESSRGGADIAVGEINAAGGINGRNIRLIYEDGQCKAPSSTSAANKLVNIDKVKIITGTICSAETLAIAPIAEANKVILLSVASSNPDITKSGDYIFRVWPSDTGQGTAMADYASSKGYTKVGILNPLSDYNMALAKAFTDSFTAKGGTVAAHETYLQDAKDFRTEITKVKDKDPDAVYIVPYGEGGLLAKQIRELEITVPILASETFGTPEILADAGDAAEGVVYATPKFDDATGKGKEVIDKFMARYGKAPSFGVVAANAYDAIYVLAQALKACPDDKDTECVKQGLYGVKDFDGAGGTLTIDENGDALKEFQLMIVKDDKFEKLEG